MSSPAGNPTRSIAHSIATMFSKILFILCALSAVTSALVHVERAANLIPLMPIGGVGAEADPSSGDTRLFYQKSDGIIYQFSVTNAFNTGHSAGEIPLIPAGESLIGTPVVATLFLDAIHVYFFSPSNVLSEYIWTNARGWRGGSSCTECLTAVGIAVVPGSKVLYAIQNPSTGALRVGFISAGFPGTLAEADKAGTAGSTWQLSPLPPSS